MLLRVFPVLLLRASFLHAADDDSDEDQSAETSTKASGIDKLLYQRLVEQADSLDLPAVQGPSTVPPLEPTVYMIPGPQEPLPGRSHDSNYWPVFPFQNQFSGGLDLDPSISRHIGGDLNIAVPSWGIMDIYGRYFNRIHDTTTKFGYLNHPVNMLDLDPKDLVELMSDPSAAHNRAIQPTLPLGKLAKSYVPLSCKPPMCNPYHANFGLGIEHDYGGSDGIEGDLDVPVPVSKGLAIRLPLAGKLYYNRENITVTYGQNLAPIEPFYSLFDYKNHRPAELDIPRDSSDLPISEDQWEPVGRKKLRRRSKRSVDEPAEWSQMYDKSQMYDNQPYFDDSSTFKDWLLFENDYAMLIDPYLDHQIMEMRQLNRLEKMARNLEDTLWLTDAYISDRSNAQRMQPFYYFL